MTIRTGLQDRLVALFDENAQIALQADDPSRRATLRARVDAFIATAEALAEDARQAYASLENGDTSVSPLDPLRCEVLNVAHKANAIAKIAAQLP